MSNAKQSPLFAHVDMDAFFAAVEVLDNPALRGKPVVVGADPRGGRGRGVVSAASYEARKFGIHSALPISTAFRLCPKAVFLHPRHERYSEMSDIIMEILEGFSPFVETISVDEAFLDLSGAERLLGKPLEAGAAIKKMIRDKTKLTASVGLAPNKFIAKVASDACKPDGLLYVPLEKIQAFLDPMPVGKIWGVGEKTDEILRGIGIRTIAQLRQYSSSRLRDAIGEAAAEHIQRLAQGIDERVIDSEEADPKSVSHDITFDKDTDDTAFLRLRIMDLCDRVARRLRRHGLSGRTVNIKIRNSAFRDRSISRTLPEGINTCDEISRVALELFDNHFKKAYTVRLLSVALSNFKDEGSGQLELFGEAPRKAKVLRAEKAMDQIREKFGDDKIARASLLEP